MDAVLEQLLDDAGDLPKEMQKEALNFVRFLKSRMPAKPSRIKKEKLNGDKLIQLLREASEKKLFSYIQDPAAWQRDLRRDRSLPGREA